MFGSCAASAWLRCRLGRGIRGQRTEVRSQYGALTSVFCLLFSLSRLDIAQLQKAFSMRYLIGFAQFWYDFIVGDDWTIAVAVVLALIVTSLLVRTGAPVWWLLPAVVLLFLGASVWRVAQKNR